VRETSLFCCMVVSSLNKAENITLIACGLAVYKKRFNGKKDISKKRA